MAFPTPTTESEMLSILKDIFFYYRVRREAFEETKLEPLVLTRMEFTALTDQELKRKAEELVAYEQQIKISELRISLSQQIDEYSEKSENLTKTYNQSVTTVTENYNESAQKIYDDALKNGLGQSTILTEQLARLESEKNKLLSQTQSEYEKELSYCNARIQSLTDRQNNLQTEFSEAFEKQVNAKYLELKDEQTEKQNEVFKYNNSLDEKEQRSKNSVAQANATLQLKYMEISAENFSKDQLIEMGYYADVIDCVCGYYNTLDSLSAWRGIANNSKIVVYLEEYYTELVYMYQSRAGV